jgi:hypothetical protein
MEDERVFALRMRGRLGRGQLRGYNDSIEQDRVEISPVIKSPGSQRWGRARNRDLAGTARARARSTQRRRCVQQIIRKPIRNQ